MTKAAMLRAKEISIKFSHIRPNGEKGNTVAGEFDFGCTEGENIGGATTPEALVEAWMKSDGHRWALLNHSSTHLGVGAHKCADGTFDCVQIFSSNPDSKVALTLDANGGTFVDKNNATTITMQIPERGYYNFTTDLPRPVRAGYTFNGWMRYGQKYSAMYINDSITLTADWITN